MATVTPTDNLAGLVNVAGLTLRPLSQSFQVVPFRYRSDGVNVAAYIVAPAGAGPWPVIIYNRGGNRSYGALTVEALFGALSVIASWGYLVVASQYRGGPGSEGTDEFGGADVNDVLNLLPIIDQLPFADATRIGMYGGSRGAMMAYLAMTKTDRLRAVATVGGLADLQRNAQQRPGMRRNFNELFGGSDQAMDQRSAVRWAERLPASTPVLMLHGTADDRVSPLDSQHLAARMQVLGRPHKLVLYEGGDHGLTQFRKEKFVELRAWFGRYVQGDAVIAST